MKQVGIRVGKRWLKVEGERPKTGGGEQEGTKRTEWGKGLGRVGLKAVAEGRG